MATIIYKLNSETAKVPTKSFEADACYDIYADIYDKAPEGGTANDATLTIEPQTVECIPTNLILTIPEGYYVTLLSRSGKAALNGLRLAQGTGVIHSGSCNQVLIALYNDTSEPQTIKQGDRICQMMLHECTPTEFVEAEDLLDLTPRAFGVYGSTDVDLSGVVYDEYGMEIRECDNVPTKTEEVSE